MGMIINVKGEVKIKSETSLVQVRRKLRDITEELGFGVTDTTRIITAASELVRNIVQFAETGVMKWEIIEEENRKGIKLTFKDQGPGIPDVEKAMVEGYSTGNGLGLGLSGTKQLMDEMDINSKVGQGTRITIKKWLRI
jgi:serine/threonine-protein kinase RsbT